jgi:hypothetical protein
MFPVLVPPELIDDPLDLRRGARVRLGLVLHDDLDPVQAGPDRGQGAALVLAHDQGPVLDAAPDNDRFPDPAVAEPGTSRPTGLTGLTRRIVVGGGWSGPTRPLPGRVVAGPARFVMGGRGCVASYP